MPHALCAVLLLCLCIPAPALAVTISFTGLVQSVVDSDDFLDGSVVAGAPVSGSYQVDLTSADTSSPFGVGLAQLSFQLGNYQFSASQNPHAVALINDRPTGIPGVTVDVWQSDAIVEPDLTPPSNSSGSFAGFAAQLEFFDFDSSVFDGSETAPIDPTDPLFYSQWDQVRLTLNSLDGTNSLDGRVQVQMAIPEPRSALLLALGLALLATRDRQRLRVRAH
jgi:hypothetical protein